MITTLERKIKHFSRILAERPGDELTLLALAEASLRQSLKLEALTAYQEVVRHHPVPEAYLAVAEIYAAQEMVHEAYGELRHLFELDPQNVEARLLINELQTDLLPPDDLRSILETKTSESAFRDARLRLKIQRAIFHRDLQERTRNATLEPGIAIHEYYTEEAKKKILRVDDLLRTLDRFEELNETLDQNPPRADLVSPTSLEEDASSDFPLGHPVGEPESEDLAPAIVVEHQTDLDTPLGLIESEQPTSLEKNHLEIEAHASSIADEVPVSLKSEYSDSASFLGDVTSSQLDQPVAIDDESLESSPPLALDNQSPQPDDHLCSPTTDDSTPNDNLDSHLAHLPLDNPPLPVSMPVASSSAEFPPGLEISLDSPLAPDLPDPGPTDDSDSDSVEPNESVGFHPDHPTYSSSQISKITEDEIEISSTILLSPESEPYPNDVHDSEALPSPPEITEASEQLTLQANHSPITLVGFDDDPSTEPSLIQHDPKPRSEDSGSVEQLESPADPYLSYGSLETEVPLTLSPARKAFYQVHAESLSSLTATLARTRGVTSIFLVAREGVTIEAVSKDTMPSERVGELVKEAFEFLETFSDNLAYWVLECSGGIFVMQRLDTRHVLIAIGQAGANFGALRYTMDKTKAKFEQLLLQVPE